MFLTQVRLRKTGLRIVYFPALENHDPLAPFYNARLPESLGSSINYLFPLFRFHPPFLFHPPLIHKFSCALSSATTTLNPNLSRNIILIDIDILRNGAY